MTSKLMNDTGDTAIAGFKIRSEISLARPRIDQGSDANVARRASRTPVVEERSLEFFSQKFTDRSRLKFAGWDGLGTEKSRRLTSECNRDPGGAVSCRPSGHLSSKSAVTSLEQPMLNVPRIQRPILIRPYSAVVMRITSPTRGQDAMKYSRRQYSRTSSERQRHYNATLHVHSLYFISFRSFILHKPSGPRSIQ